MLMNEGDDVIHVNVGSGITTAHIASLANSTESTVFAFGIQSDLQRHQIVYNLERFGCRCTIRFQIRFQIRVVSKNFVGL